MLFFDSTAQNISHIQGTFISDTEIENTTQFLKITCMKNKMIVIVNILRL